MARHRLCVLLAPVLAGACATLPPAPPHAFVFAGLAAGEADYVDLATIRSTDYGDRLVWLLRVYGGEAPKTYSLLENEISCRYRQSILRYGADFDQDGSPIEEGGGDGTITPIVPGTLSDTVFGYVCLSLYSFPDTTLISDPGEAVKSGEALIAQNRKRPARSGAPPYP